MFFKIRIINGIIAWLASFIFCVFFTAVGASFLVTPVGLWCICILLLFVSDLFLRKVGHKSDFWFCVAWELCYSSLFAWQLWRFSMGTGEGTSASLYQAAFIATFTGLPLLSNGIYLAILHMDKKAPA
jgi:hypothetical protein